MVKTMEAFSSSVFCVNICDPLEFTVPPISVPILSSASDERTFYIIVLISVQQQLQHIKTVADLKSYIEKLFRISPPTCLQTSSGSALENARDVKSLNSILHRRILVCAATNNDSSVVVVTSSKSTKTNAASASDVRRGLPDSDSDNELCNLHGITSYVKITLDRYEVTLQKRTVQVFDLSSVEPLRALKARRWLSSSPVQYGTPKADNDNDHSGKDFDATTSQAKDYSVQVEAVTNPLTDKEVNNKIRTYKKFRSLAKLKERLINDFPDIPLVLDIEKGHKTPQSLCGAVKRHFSMNFSVPTKKVDKLQTQFQKATDRVDELS